LEPSGCLAGKTYLKIFKAIFLEHLPQCRAGLNHAGFKRVTGNGWRCGPTAPSTTPASVQQNFLLDPQGKIVASNLRGEALHNTLGELLNAAK
jgi:hypothetical protein